MTSYPPYGAPLNENGYTAPQGGSYNAGVVQYPYQQPNPTPYYYGQDLSSGISPAPRINTYSFQSNTHDNRSSIPSHGVNDGVTFSNYSGQRPYNTLPPPPYPPVPIPYAASSYVQYPNQHTTNLNTATGNSYSPPHSLYPHKPPIDKSVLDKPRSPTPLELEDGEVDDAEDDKIVTHTEAASMGSSFSQSSRGEQNENEGSRPAATHINEINQDGTITPDTYLRNELNENVPHFLEEVNDLPSSQLMDDLSKSHLSEENISQMPKESVLSTEGKAYEAKRALQDLRSMGYTFDRIVEKGINPDILKQIYTMMSIPLTSSPFEKPTHFQTVKPTLGNESTAGTPLAVAVKTGDLSAPQQMKEISTMISPASTGRIMVNGKGTSRPHNTPSTEEEMKDKPSSVVSKTIKNVLSKPQVAKTLDRKDYIARMLAAKAGKSTSSPSGPPKFTPASEKKPATITEPVVPLQTKTLPAISSHEQSNDQQSVLSPVDTKTITPARIDSDSIEVEAKRKAQTDLARQKIEALKIREGKQQEARKAAGKGSENQQAQSETVPLVPSLSDINVMVSRTTIPSRQGSYFSPISQKPPFSIPGLFMTESSTSTKTLPHSENQIAKTSPLKDENSIPAEVAQQSQSANIPFSEPTPTSTEPSSLTSYTADAGTSPLPPVIGTPATNRKRQKAADFIDSPSTRVKRPLGEQEYNSLIIDISEDETSSLADDGMDVNVNDRRTGLTSQPQGNDYKNDKSKSLRDLPPLSSAPAHKKPPVMTPPITQISSAPKDLKGLKSKEIEIELMNRKIRELEQRITAKRTISRAQTPGPSASATVSSPASQHSHQATNQPSAIKGVVSSRSEPNSPTSVPQPSISAVDVTEMITEEQLIAEQRLQEAQLAKAEVERSIAADAIRASETDQCNGGAIGQDVIGPRDEDQQRDNADHSSESVIIQGLDAQIYEEISEPRDSEPDEVDKLPKPQQPESSFNDEQMISEERQRQLRKSKIESDLPIIDATVRSRREKLESLREELASLENQYQKDMHDRAALMEELLRLSQTTATLEIINPSPPAMDASPTHITTSEVIAQDLPRPPLPSKIPSESVAQDTLVAARIQDHSDAQQASPAPISPLQDVQNKSLDEQLEEDVMDISRSDMDEGEITDFSSEAASENHKPLDNVVEKETYESLNEIIIDQIDVDHVPQNDVAEPEDADMEDDVSLQTRNSHDVVSSTYDIKPIPHSISMRNEEATADLHPSSADSSESDDYEPPEPSPVAKKAASPRAVLDHDPEASFSPIDADSIVPSPVIQPYPQSSLTVEQPEGTPGSKIPERAEHQSSRPTEHFSTYESPLKQFKAFRYHPKYLKEVSSGFRSLTYSNAIDPKVPFCHYELDGICNDDSCQSQHIKSIGLSDEKILVDLGATPDGLSHEDAEAFTNGLRELIQNIRSRKIRDVNVVAQEITAHRARFLNDPSKVLPL